MKPKMNPISNPSAMPSESSITQFPNAVTVNVPPVDTALKCKYL